MEVTIESGARLQPTGLLALPVTALDPASARLPARVAALDRAANGRIGQAVAAGDFRGKRGETLLLHPGPGLPAKRLLMIGLGGEAGVGAEVLRDTAALAVREARQRRAERAALATPASRRLRAAALAQALAEGAALGAYRFDRYRTQKEEDGSLGHLSLWFEKSGDARAARAGAATGALLASYQNLARDLS